MGPAARPLARVTLAALAAPVLERLLAVLAPEAYATCHDAIGGPTPLSPRLFRGSFLGIENVVEP